jgi:hypothetical protein
MFKFINLLFVCFVITTNAYSQKKDCSDSPFYFYLSGDKMNRIIYTDSTIVNSVTVYTDSLIVDFAVVYTDSIIVDASVIYTDSMLSYKVDYPITLTNNPPFKKAIYRDYCEFSHQIFLMTSILSRQQGTNFSDEKKGYYILSSDDRFIRYAFLTKADGELYDKYSPIEENNKTCFSFSKRQYGKLVNWIQQEIDKGLIVSVTIGSKNKKTYIAKLFSN